MLTGVSLALFADSVHWLDGLIQIVTSRAAEGSFFSYGFNVRSVLALFFVSLSCGAVGALVVGGRMAFFSDALAHCSFAGVSIGFVLFSFLLIHYRPAEEFWDWVTPVMLIFGMMVGFGIAWVRARTGLASDTVIGIFFAFAIGLAAALRKLMQNRRLFTLEDFLFGDPLLVRAEDIVYLAILSVITAVVLALIFNDLLLSGFNQSLALSRRVRIEVVSYVFIMLLAVVVTLCVRTVGVLLINALLVVPAATAANLGRNLRQVFWLTVFLCLFSCLAGQFIEWEVTSATKTPLGISGTTILVSVLLFGVSAVVGPLLQKRRAGAVRSESGAA